MQYTSYNEFLFNASHLFLSLIKPTGSRRYPEDIWLVGWLVVLGLRAHSDSISVYVGPSPRERKKEEKI